MKLDWKAALGIGITVALLWWLLRDVPIAEVWAHIEEANLWLLLASVAVATFGFVIRAWRWKVLLHPVLPGTSFRNRYAAVNIGFMANNLLPARIGEFARAYALARVEPVAVSAALGTLVVERVLDALTYVGILLVVVSRPSFPMAAAMEAGGILAKMRVLLPIFIGGLLLVLTLLVAFPRAIVRIGERIARLLPGDFARPVVSALEAFLDSLKVLRTPGLLLQAVLWSATFWVWHGLSFWLALIAFDIHVGPAAALFTEVVVGFGVAVPAAPGFLGTFQGAASVALSLYGVPPASLLAFAFGYWAAGFIPVTLIGLYYAGSIGLSLKDIGASETKVEDAVETAHPLAKKVLGREDRP